MKGIKVEIKGKEYVLGFKNRASIRKAEALGVNVVSPERIATFSDNLFYAALMDKQPNISKATADDIIEAIIEEYGINYYNEIVAQLAEFLRAFYGSQEEKSEKKIELVEM